MRNPVAAGAEHPVERLAGGHQLRPRFSAAMILSTSASIDRIGDAGEILRALDGGGLRGEIVAQRIAGRAGETEALHHEIEVEIIDALAILHGIDDAQGRVDAEHRRDS